IHALDHEREARVALVARWSRAHRADAEGRGVRRRIRGPEPARPLVPRPPRRALDLAAAEQGQPFAGARSIGAVRPRAAAEHVHAAALRRDLDAGARARELEFALRSAERDRFAAFAVDESSTTGQFHDVCFEAE